MGAEMKRREAWCALFIISHSPTHQPTVSLARPFTIPLHRKGCGEFSQVFMRFVLECWGSELKTAVGLKRHVTSCHVPTF